jgi:hypothetical protein
MAWVSPPTFVADTVLQASKLQILSDNLSYLHGYVTGDNNAFVSVELTTDTSAYFLLRHRQRYLKTIYLCQADYKIYYDNGGGGWTLVYHDGAPNGTANDSGVVDLNSFGFTVGRIYTIKVTMDSGTIWLLKESDTASW